MNETVRRLLPLAIPSLLVGVLCSLILLLVSGLANLLQDFLWITVPAAFGIPGYSPGWILLTLTVAGLLVGLVVWKVPGHGGADPAKAELIEPPQSLGVLPSLALTAIIGLAGGVSLGPENPIIAINVALAVWLGMRLMPRFGGEIYLILAAAGTIGALFGTPVAAALIFSETVIGKVETPLWDRLFAPLVAAGAGALTTAVLAGEEFALDVAAYPGFHIGDWVSGSLIASAAALIGLAAVYLFPWPTPASGA